MHPPAAPCGHARGLVFSTHRNRPVADHSWCFWYLQHSKKVWFRHDVAAAAGLMPVFTYDGRPILHRSEVEASWTRHHYVGRQPVVWGDFVGTGLAPGPAGTGLYLELWTRWTWLHPEACGRPERFAVEFFEPSTAA